MHNDATDGPKPLPPELEQLIRQVFGDQAEPAIRALSEAGLDPTAVMRAAGLNDNPANMAFLADQLKRVFTAPPSGEVVNWQMAHDGARQASASAGPDPTPSAADSAAVREAFNVAEVWLDQATGFPPAPAAPVTLSCATWIEGTMPQWQAITTPVAKSVTAAMSKLLAQQAEEHPGMAETVQGMSKMLQSMTGGLFGLQIGQAVGAISREVFGYTDTGLPMGPKGAIGLVARTVDTFADESGLPVEEVRFYLAAREAAHGRLFGHVRWLADHLFGAVESYASEIAIDMAKLENAMSQLDMSNPEAVKSALSSGVFAIELSPTQRAALRRLETALALVEGWVDVAVTAAVAGQLPHTDSLNELIRRRRAVGGPAERTFATLVGLEMRPRKAREASRLWDHVTRELGADGRDQLWQHPDFLPTPEDLTAPEGFLDRREAKRQADQAVDAEIEALLSSFDNPDGTPPVQ